MKTLILTVFLSLQLPIYLLANGLPVETIILKESSNYIQKTNYIGQIEAAKISNTSFEIAGVLKDIFVDEGQEVQKGTLLATLDTKRLEALKDEIQASIDEAISAYSLSLSTLKRIEAARQIDGVSIQELDEATQQVAGSLATLNRQKASLARIELDIEKSKLFSPFDGTIIKRAVDEGSFLNPGQLFLQIQKSDSLEARISLPHMLSDTFQKDNFTELLHNGQKIRATVKSVLPFRDRFTSLIDVLFTLPFDKSLRPGDLISLALESKIDIKGFWVPLSSLTHSTRALWSVYTIDASNKAIKKEVDILYQDEKQAFIKGDLKDTQRIIISGIHKLVPNQLVSPL